MSNYSDMQLISTHYVMSNQVGYHGNLFGGIMLSWIDEAGAALGCEIAETGRMVTKYISALYLVREGRIWCIAAHCRTHIAKMETSLHGVKSPPRCLTATASPPLQ